MAMAKGDIDLKDILAFSFFESAQDILAYVTKISNIKNCDVLQALDSFNRDLEHKYLKPICTFNWVKLLKETHEDEDNTGSKNHFEELTEGGNADSYTILPSSLLRLIRNLDQHASDKVAKASASKNLLTRLFPNGCTDKQEMLCYFLEKFPKLIPALWACKQQQTHLFDWRQPNLVDQVVLGLWNSLQYETDKGNLLASFTCTRRTNRKPFNIEIFGISKETFHSLRGLLIKVEDAQLIVSKHGKTIRYVSKSPSSEFLTVGIDNFTEEIISDRVVILAYDPDLTKLKQDLQKFVVFKAEPNNVGWFDISESKQNKVLANSIVKIQNIQYKCKDLFPDSSMLDSLEGSSLNSLLKHNSIEVFRPKVYHSPKYYIKRYLEISQVDSSFFDKPQKCLFIFLNTHTNDYAHINKKLNCNLQHFDINERPCNQIVSNVVAIAYKCQYSTAINCIENLVPNNTEIYLLKYDKGMFIQLVSEEVFFKKLEGLQFISGSPGYGKSTLLHNLHTTSSSFRNITIFTHAAELVRNLNMNFTEVDLQHAIVNCVSCESDFEKSLLTAFLTDCNFTVTFLVDAVDEVSTEKVELINKVIKQLSSKENIRLVCVIRKYLEQLYSDTFHAKMYKLHQISYYDRLVVVQGHLEEKYNEKNDLRTSHQLAKSILSRFRLKAPLTPFLIISLVDLYVEKKICSVEIGTEQIEAEGICTHQTYRVFDNIADVYKEIVERNFSAYLKEKLKLTSETMSHSIFNLDLKPIYIRSHMWLALKEIYPTQADEFLGAFGRVSEVAPGQGFLENVDPVMFTHRSYSEYFVDLWFYSVTTGDFNLDMSYCKTFSLFFRERYIISLADQFLNTMLTTESVCVFPFDFDTIGIFECMKFMVTKNDKHNIAHFLVNSMSNYNKSDIKELLEKHKHKTIDISKVIGKVRIPSGFVCTVPSAIIRCTASLGWDELFVIAFEHEKRNIMGTEEDAVNLYNYLLHVMLYRSAFDGFCILAGKAKILWYLKEESSFPFSRLELRGDHKNKLFMTHNTHLDLMVCLLMAKVRLKCAHAKGPQLPLEEQLRKLFQSTCLEKSEETEKPKNRKVSSMLYQRVATEYFNILFCLRKSSEKSTQNVNHVFSHEKLLIHMKSVHSEGFLGCPKCTVYAFHNAYRNLAEDAKESPEAIDEVLSNFQTSSNSLADYYVANYVLCKLIGDPDSPVFQIYFVGQVLDIVCETHTIPIDASIYDNWSATNKSAFNSLVLSCSGVNYKHPIACCLLNRMLENAPNIEFKLCDTYSNLFKTRNSPFLAACKTSNANLACLLAKSFHIDWFKDLTDIHVMAVFRALSWGRPSDSLAYVINVLEQHNYKVPIPVVKEFLIFADLNLFRMFVNRLGFSVDKWMSIDPENQIGLIHIVLKSSLTDSPMEVDEVELETRQSLINLIIEMSPGQLEHRDKLGRTPLLMDDVNFEMVDFLIRKGANVHARDNEGNNLLHVYFRNWKRHYPNHAKYYNYAIYLAKIMGSAMGDKNVKGQTPINVKFVMETGILSSQRNKMEVNGFNVDNIKVIQEYDNNFEYVEEISSEEDDGEHDTGAGCGVRENVTEDSETDESDNEVYTKQNKSRVPEQPNVCMGCFAKAPSKRSMKTYLSLFSKLKLT